MNHGLTDRQMQSLLSPFGPNTLEDQDAMLTTSKRLLAETSDWPENPDFKRLEPSIPVFANGKH